VIPSMHKNVEIRLLQFKEIRIPFKAAFRHASAERAETSSVWVEAVSERGGTGYGESCPRSYVTGETVDSARLFLFRHEVALRADVHDLASLRAWMGAHADDLDAHPAAWCATELAILDLLAKERGQTVEALLALPPLCGLFYYSAVLGDADRDEFQATATRYRHHGFTDFKIKLSGNLERDREKVVILRGLDVASLRVRVDANNLWESADEAIAFLRALDYPFFGIEEPIRPNHYADLARIGEALRCKIILDESFRCMAQFEPLRDAPDRWLINLRVSKMCGLLRSLAIVETARAWGIGLIVGAQVGETSLLTRAGLPVAQAAREGLVAQEGAFGTLLLAHDVCDPPLMFGAGGVLDCATYPHLNGPGFGLVSFP